MARADDARRARNEESRRARLFQQTHEVFTPNRPVQVKELFAGRIEVMAYFLQHLSRAGQHVVVYGEPGVGKTSLAKFVATLAHQNVVFVTCQSSITFAEVIEQALSQIDEAIPSPGTGFAATERVQIRSLIHRVAGRPLTPILAKEILQGASREKSLAIFVDEFDRLAPESRREFAEFLKLLADSASRCSFVLIGIAHDVSALVEEHWSVDRCLEQVHMPRMSPDEISDLITRGLDRLGLEMARDARAVVVEASRGLPFYTHAICLYASQSAIVRRDGTVRIGDAVMAMRRIVGEKAATHGEKLKKATHHREDTQALRALRVAATCAKDDHGSFTFTAYRRRYTSQYEKAPQNLSSLINDLAKAGRGEVLVVEGAGIHKVIRFRNPAFEAYVALEESLGRYRS